MRTTRFRPFTKQMAGCILCIGLQQLLPMKAHCAPEIVDTENTHLELDLRLQPRLELENANSDWTRDFMVRRTRLKLGGNRRMVKFKFEWKIDATDRIGANPAASVENAYIQFPLGRGAELRAGLYDQPFSRDRLTSDSKQLAVDRGAVSNVPDAVGLADNATGLEVLGKIHGGRTEYALGLFDNRFIRGDFQDLPMVVGRLDFNLGATKDVFQDAHFDDKAWYSVGVNGSWQGEIEDAAGANEGMNGALGIDGMMDISTSVGRLLARSEMNVIKTEVPAGGNSLDTRTWMLGLGLLVGKHIQPIARFDQVRLDDAQGGGTRNTTYIGANVYRNDHDLKVQGDVRFEAGTGKSVDGVRIQAQVEL